LQAVMILRLVIFLHTLATRNSVCVTL